MEIRKGCRGEIMKNKITKGYLIMLLGVAMGDSKCLIVPAALIAAGLWLIYKGGGFGWTEPDTTQRN